MRVYCVWDRHNTHAFGDLGRGRARGRKPAERCAAEMSAKPGRPAFGSIELQVKLVCDTLLIDDERANERALNMVANSVFRSDFRTIVMKDFLYLPIISRLQPPARGLEKYGHTDHLALLARIEERARAFARREHAHVGACAK